MPTLWHRPRHEVEACSQKSSDSAHERILTASCLSLATAAVFVLLGTGITLPKDARGGSEHPCPPDSWTGRQRRSSEHGRLMMTVRRPCEREIRGQLLLAKPPAANECQCFCTWPDLPEHKSLAMIVVVMMAPSGVTIIIIIIIIIMMRMPRGTDDAATKTDFAMSSHRYLMLAARRYVRCASSIIQWDDCVCCCCCW